MSDITPEILPRLKAFRLPGVDLDEQFVYPDYLGGSILNLPASICQWLGAEPLGTVPLRLELTVALPNDVRRVILVLVGLAQMPVWAQLAAQVAWVVRDLPQMPMFI